MFLETLIARRKALKLTQAELGEAAGYRGPYISKIETGKADPSLSALEAIAAACRAEIVLVPLERLTEVRRLLEGPAPGANPSVGSAFDDIFIPDPKEGTFADDGKKGPE